MFSVCLRQPWFQHRGGSTALRRDKKRLNLHQLGKPRGFRILRDVTLMDAGLEACEESVNIIHTCLFHKRGSWFGMARHFWGLKE